VGFVEYWPWRVVMVSSVAGLPICWLPVWVPVISWVGEAPLLAANVAAADPAVSSAAKLRRRKVFDIQSLLFAVKCEPQERCRR
jgi:hypothetical protein